MSKRNVVVVVVVAVFAALSGVVVWQVRGVDAAGQTVAQDERKGVYRGVTTAARFDVSPPLTTLKGTFVDNRKPEGTEEVKTGYERPNGPQDVDELVQGVLGPAAIPTPLVNFNAQGNPGSGAPPDPVGDVGPNHYVAMSNGVFQIFNKSGTSLFGPVPINSLWSGFGGACQSLNSGDPIVIYDQLDDRWILTQFTSSAVGGLFYNCVAVSTTGDPTGTYFRYAFTTGNNFPDYPKYGMWHDALYISTREFTGGSGGPFGGVGAYAINRAHLIAGNPAAQVISFRATPAAVGMFNIGDGLLPTDIDGSNLPPAGSPNYFIGSMDQGGQYGAPQDALTVWKFQVNFAVPASSTFTLANTLPISAFDTAPSFCSGRSCIPQPNTTQRLDHLGYRQRPLYRAAYRNFGTHESIVTNQSVEVPGAMSGIRWWELRLAGTTPSVFQEGTYAPGTTDGIHRWMGSIAQDRQGNMALGYSAGNVTTFPGIRYTGRLAGDPLGTMPQGEGIIINGTGSQTGFQRWGDYTSMNIDPVDDCTFWYVNEWIPTTSSSGWRLRVASFKFNECSAGGTPTPTATPTASPTATPTATPTPSPTGTPGGTRSAVVSGLIAGAGRSERIRPIAGVTLTAPGMPTVIGTTNSTGHYSMSGFNPNATYTVTPTLQAVRSGTSSGIFANDAALISQHLAGSIKLDAAQLRTAMVSGSPTVTASDAEIIAKWIVGLGSGVDGPGQWVFTPASRSYTNITANQINQDYSAVLVGDVSRDWADHAPLSFASSGSLPFEWMLVSAPAVQSLRGEVISLPVRIDNLDALPITSYQFDVEYDPAVITPAMTLADLTGTLADGRLAIVSNVISPGLIRVVVYGATPVTTDGVYANLRFTVTASSGASTSLNISNVRVNDGERAVTTAAGRITVK